MKKQIRVGNVILGDGSIKVQTMLKKPLSQYSTKQLKYFYNLGCDIIRFSISDETNQQINDFVKKCKGLFPVVSDIQGNTSQAINSIKSGCQAIRINPANFNISDLGDIVKLSKEYDSAIRIGVNEGSLKDRSDDKILSFFDYYINFFEKSNFSNIALSIKSSSIERTIHLNRLLAKVYDYPLHVGITEAGWIFTSAVRTTVGLVQMVQEFDIDTIRYSVSGDEMEEIRCGYEFLQDIGKCSNKFNLVGCPMCSRAGIDTNHFCKIVEKKIFENFNIRDLNMKLSIMGCPVNGLGEASDSDLAICATKKEYMIFKQGKKIFNTAEKSEFKKKFIEIVGNFVDSHEEK